MAAPSGHSSETLQRRTLVGAARVSGIGLFTGKQAQVVIKAGAAGDGVVFRRTDLPGAPTVPARIQHVVSEQRRTVLQGAAGTGASTARIETVEHILSALAGLGITDAHIDVDGPEIPIGDGSAAPFTSELRAAGIAPLPNTSETLTRITAPMTACDRGGQIDILPLDDGRVGCEYIYVLDYGPGSPIPPQQATFFVAATSDGAEYEAVVAPARTFSTLAEATVMRQMGMFTQFTPKDLLVIGPDGPVDNALRFANEPAMHKLLDTVGDLSLCGRRIVGRVVATRSGHALNHEMARMLAALP